MKPIHVSTALPLKVDPGAFAQAVEKEFRMEWDEARFQAEGTQVTQLIGDHP